MLTLCVVTRLELPAVPHGTSASSLIQGLSLLRPALTVLVEQISAATWCLLKGYLQEAMQVRMEDYAQMWGQRAGGNIREEDAILGLNLCEVVVSSLEAVGGHPLMEELVRRVKDTLRNETGERTWEKRTRLGQPA